MSIVTAPREIQLLIFGQLRVVDLVRVSETCHHLKEVARDPSLWKKLTLSYVRSKNKNEACREHVSRCSSLMEIIITGEEKSIRSDKIMAVLMKAKDTLTSIILSPSFAGLSNSSFEKIGEMTQLTHLAVGGGKLESGGISALACLTELKTLKIPDIDAHSYDIPMAKLVDLFSKLKKLEKVEIKMEDNFPSDEAVKSLLNNNPNFHHLDITPSGLLEDYHYHYIPYWHIHTYPGDVLSSSSLDLIADMCPQLTHIGIGHLESFSATSITKLVTKCPKLTHANFEQTNFSNSALDMLARNCPDLEYLNITCCRYVTGEALERFADTAMAANLKHLCISKCFYGSHLTDRLKQNLPHVKIVIHDFEDIIDEED